jgi:hypothetical protein
VSIGKVLQGCIILCQGRFLLLKLNSEKDPILTLFSQLPNHTIQNQDKEKRLNMELEKFNEMESESSKVLMF